MQNVDFLDQLLEIQKPWQVLNVLVTNSSKRLDIFIGFGEPEKKGLFGFAFKGDFLGGSKRLSCPYCQTDLPRNGEYETISLQHLPIAGFATYLQVPVSGTVKSIRPECSCMRSWGSEKARYTKAMRDFLVTLLHAGASSQMVVKLTGITEDQLMKIREFAELARSERVAKPSSGAAVTDGNIPGIDNQKWRQLIKGELPFSTQVVALNLLLQRTRRETEKSSDEATMAACVRQLHHFIVRNQKLLKPEIEQLNK
jgi:hypothetical protein